jgi:uncharacterized membrane protein
MSDNGKITTAALLGSVAANIFLAAFVLGRLTSPAAAPHYEQLQKMGVSSGYVPAPLGMQGRGPGGPGGGPGGPGMMGRGPGGPGGPQPPPLFRPEDVFNAQEMQQAMQETQANFQKADQLRADFANKLEQGSVSKDDVLKHFADMDAIMNSVKLKVQEKTAEKISTMSDDERKQLAQRMKQRGGPPEMNGRSGPPTPPGAQGIPGMPGQGLGPQPAPPPPDQAPGQGPDNGPPPPPAQ